MSVRFLVVEGNTREVRERHKAGFGTSPAENYGETLVELAGKASFDIVCPADPDAALPHNSALQDYDGVVMTGSSLHLWQGEVEALRQIEFARAVFRANVPYFGSCWGLQVAAVAAGGEVRLNPRGREMGYARRILPNEAGRAHPLLAGRPAVFDAPCSHLDEVATLPPNAVLLASNAVSGVQAAEFTFEGGTFWGVQYHPEFSHSLIAFLMERRGETLIAEGLFRDARQHRDFIADLRQLDAPDPPKDIAFRYALGPDLTDPMQRLTELRNFIAFRAKPHRAKRLA